MCEPYCIAFDNLKLIDLSEEDDNLIPLPLRDFVDDLRLSVTFDNVNEPNCIFRDESFRKSLDWDCAFFTNPGLLNVEELCLINKGFKNDDTEQISSRTCRDGRPNRVSNLKSSVRLNQSKLQSSSSDSFESIKRKITPVKTKSTTTQSHHSYESSSSNTSSKSIKKKIVTRNNKVTSSSSPSSVLSPLSSPCSSSSSSASHFQNAVSTKSFQTPKLTSQIARNSSTIKIESSRLRMPSQRLGFFDEKPLMSFNISPIFAENCNARKTTSTSCSKLKTNDQIHKDKPKGRINLEMKTLKGNNESFHMINLNKKLDECDRCSLKKSPNEKINTHLEANKPDNNVTKVKGQTLNPPNAGHTSTHCLPTPFAEKMTARSDNVNVGLNIKLFEDADSHIQPESVEPRKLSLLGKSLEWDRAFLTNAGLLTHEELCMINEGIKKAELNQPLPKSSNHKFKKAEINQTSLELQIHKDKPKGRILNGDNDSSHIIDLNKKVDESDRCSLNKSPRKSLDWDWDSTFFTNAGLLTHEELWMINGGIEKIEFNQPSPKTLKHVFKKAEINQTTHGIKKHIRSLEVARYVFKDVNLGIHSSTVKRTNSRQSQKLNFKIPVKNRRPNCSIGHKDWFSCLPIDCIV